ncbi:MAG TPA: hypothetical protein VKQ72_08935 [Aggregatilineales bacterium]|nr:hypothetical protein [Aggregatilineales bacterium]
MPIQTQFLRDGRVMLNTFTEPLELPEVDDMIERVNRDFFDKALKPVHTIDDLTLIKQLPPNILSNARPLIPKRHQMAGHGYIVVKAGLLSMIARSLLNVIGRDNLQVVYSIEDALEKIDQTLWQEGSSLTS